MVIVDNCTFTHHSIIFPGDL